MTQGAGRATGPLESGFEDEVLGPDGPRAPTPETWDGVVPEPEVFLQDPHGWARTLARRHAVVERPQLLWILRHDLVERLVKHPGTRQFGAEIMHLRGVESGPLYDWWGRIVLTANGKRHTRLRAPLQRAFSFPLIARLRPRVRDLAESLIDEMADEMTRSGLVDFIDRFASRLPVLTICELLGVPRQDIPVLKRWADTLSHAFGFFPPEEVARLDDAIRNLEAYVGELVLERREAPREDFISDLVATLGETGDYSAEELTAQVLGLMFAGSDTTRTAISVAVTLLLQHRAQWCRLVEDRSLLKGAVEESLRFEPTVGSLPRICAEDMEIAGVPVTPGMVMVMNIAAAQRDPARYEDPDRFDITRDNPSRMAIGFGGGPHRCLGEALARIELEESLDALATRLPGMRLSCGLPHFVAMATGIRRLEGLTVSL